MNPPPPPPPTTAASGSPRHPPQLALQITSELCSRYSFPVSPEWISKFLATVKTPPPPLPALTSTAHFRLLNSDLTQSLLSTRHDRPSASTSTPVASLLPPNATDLTIQSQTIPANTPVQVLVISDIGSSKWDQIEAIERVERGEEIRGREVIRNIPIVSEISESSSTSTGTNTPSVSTLTTTTTKKSKGPHKLLLQDASGTRIWGFESKSIPKIFMTFNNINSNTTPPSSSSLPDEGRTCIGCKILLKKGCVIRRGMVVLTPEDVVILGGKVEAWDEKFRKGLKARLKQEMEREVAQATTTAAAAAADSGDENDVEMDD